MRYDNKSPVGSRSLAYVSTFRTVTVRVLKLIILIRCEYLKFVQFWFWITLC